MLKVSEILKAKRMERFFTLDYSDAKGLTFSLGQAAITKDGIAVQVGIQVAPLP